MFLHFTNIHYVLENVMLGRHRCYSRSSLWRKMTHTLHFCTHCGRFFLKAALMQKRPQTRFVTSEAPSNLACCKRCLRTASVCAVILQGLRESGLCLTEGKYNYQCVCVREREIHGERERACTERLCGL